jgi:preprotein translocase SecE subunit
MARQTRQQRRARRAQQEPALAGGPPSRGPAKPTANGGAEPSREPSQSRPRRADEHEKHGFGPWIFVQESYGELKKVEWPSRQAVISGTAVVLIACAIVGAFLWVNDEVWKYVVQHVLLR